jgi:hypothetical protein
MNSEPKEWLDSTVSGHGADFLGPIQEYCDASIRHLINGFACARFSWAWFPLASGTYEAITSAASC